MPIEHPSGRYQVTLKFQEPVVGAVGGREFDVLINGNIALKRFDIFASAGGKLKGVDRSFETISRGGGIVIEFRPTKGNALVSALSITSLDNIKGSFREWRRPRSQTSASDAGTLW